MLSFWEPSLRRLDGGIFRNFHLRFHPDCKSVTAVAVQGIIRFTRKFVGRVVNFIVLRLARFYDAFVLLIRYTVIFSCSLIG